MYYKIIWNRFLPLKDYKCMALWPLVLVRKDERFQTVDLDHELIHCEQQFEILILGCIVCICLYLLGCGWWSLTALLLYYLLYGLMYLAGLAFWRNHRMAYRNNPMEQEAYEHQTDPDYLSSRRKFAWMKYIGRKTYEVPK